MSRTSTEPPGTPTQRHENGRWSNTRCNRLTPGTSIGVRWWPGETLPLAIDATNLREHEVVLSLSVLYRSSAIPVAWVVLPHRGKGAWMPHLQRLLGLLAAAVPPTLRVLVLSDQGLWSPTLWRQIQANGWHPLMRVRPDATFAPAGLRRQPEFTLPSWRGVNTEL